MAATGQGDWNKPWGQIVAQAWQDEGFKKRLLTEPAAVLNERGLVVTPGVQVKVLENSDQVLHLILPLKPSAVELSEEELAKVAGGNAPFVRKHIASVKYED